MERVPSPGAVVTGAPQLPQALVDFLKAQLHSRLKRTKLQPDLVLA